MDTNADRVPRSFGRGIHRFWPAFLFTFYVDNNGFDGFEVTETAFLTGVIPAIRGIGLSMGLVEFIF